ncbi:Uncharacterized protein HZ326_5974 [Fusarium oxysporum f. sp. albedinis]|nr:Uncharacterized protein HZ326_5974 [Fusarium oxysporum f. sp. albedinis]
MVTVAVAGGTGKVGRTIVEAIVAAGEHKVVILSREPKENKLLEEEIGASVLAADIHNISALTELFEKHNVHTVISTLGMNGPEPIEIDIIRASEASQATKRFISSDWGLPHTEKHAAQANSANNKLRAQDELRKTNLEWTSIHIGFFLDFWGSSKSAAKSNLHTPSTFVDIKHRAAAIPGSGDVPVTFTYSRDVAKFVAALLNLEKWEEATYIIGDKVTFNEMVKIAEEATGDKFNVVYDSVETLEKGELSELPGHEAMFANIPAPKAVMKKVMSAYGLWAESGGFNLDESGALNNVFPEIKPITVREFLEDAWGSEKK